MELGSLGPGLSLMIDSYMEQSDCVQASQHSSGTDGVEVTMLFNFNFNSYNSYFDKTHMHP